MSQYFLAVHHDPDAADGAARMAQMSPEELQQVFAAVETFNTDLRGAGAWVFAGGLQPVDTSTVVDHTGDSPVVTDGPYSDSKISLGGFWVIEAADLGAAQAWAQQASRACLGKVEVRPFQDEPED